MADAPARKPAAVLIPRHYPAAPGARDRHLALKDEFGPILGVPRVYTRSVGGAESLVTGSPDDSRYFGTFHPRAGQERYRWEDRGDGVLYGYPVDETPAAPAAE